MIAFLSANFYNKTPAMINSQELAELELVMDDIEQTVGMSFAHGMYYI